MIESGHQRQALSALHRVLIYARHLALTDGTSADLAEILDWAELLPIHILANQDRTAEYRDALEAIARKFPAFQSAVVVFDGPDLSDFVERRRAAKTPEVQQA